MRKNVLRTGIVAGLLVSGAAQAQTTLYGVTTANEIFTISNVNAPGAINGPYAISGVASGQMLAALDARPGNGALYALGYDSVTQMAELYTISNSGTVYTANAVSGTLASMDLGSTSNAAFDFVSTADNEIRVVGRNGNNYLMNADNGTVTSTGTSGLSFAGGDLYSGLTSALAATAYTNSYYGADATDEVGYDAVNNVLVKMDAGSYLNGFMNTSNTLHSIGATTGVVFNALGSIGMDTWYDSTTYSNSIYMTGSTLLSGAHLYKYDLTSATGALTDLGAIGSGSLNVRDIAFGALGAKTGSLAGHLVTGLSLNLRKLIYFDSQNPSNISKVVSLSGMASGQSMVGIDYSANGNLYGLGYNSGSHTYQLYTIDSATGTVTAINSTPMSLNLGSDDGSGNYVNTGFRFMATSDNLIRVIGNNGSVNSVIDANTGAVIETDTALQYITGDASFGLTPRVTSMAYTGFSGDTSTHMFGFDANTGAMVMFDNNNTATGFGIGSSGYISTSLGLGSVLSLLSGTAAYNNAYMNIAYDAATNTNIGFIAANYLGDSSLQQNYAVMYDMSDMLTGYHRGTSVSPVPVGTIGYGTPVKDIAIRRSGLGTTAIGTPVAHVNDLLVYPNPAITNTNVVLPAMAITTVQVDVIDLNGRIDRSFQYAPGAMQLQVDLGGLPTGLYSVRVYDPTSGYYNLKVVKE